MSSLGVT